MEDINALTTEQRNPHTTNLDTFSSLDIARTMNSEDKHAVEAVEQVLPQVARAIDWAHDALVAGGRIIYIGAGTSGRLGVLDAVECPPTFGVDYNTVVGIIAGGEGAFVRAAEGIEDKREAAVDDLVAHHLTSNDIVIGIAASGRTPYVISALTYARSAGCKTVAISCNAHTEVSACADLAIEAITGPEVLSGSTRLKAGTAQKLILNMISTGAMTRFGKVYKNLMVDVRQNNQKLQIRAINIVREACGCTQHEAEHALAEAHGEVKTAICMLLLGCDATRANEALTASCGHVRAACNMA